MIVGVHDMFGGLAHYWHERVSNDGALWIVMMDGLFLIPLIFSVFFYPKEVLIGVGALALLSLGALEVLHLARTHRQTGHWFWH